jgi:hypothetical protein
MTRIAISSNHYSQDLQVKDAVSYLNPEQKERLLEVYPEFDELIWDGSWVHAGQSGVDPEFMSWVQDWIEQDTEVYWEDGEPWVES